MLIWDYVLTFGMEVDLVWKSKWNVVKGLYLFQRYLPFIDTAWLLLYSQSNVFSIVLTSSFVDQTGGSVTKTGCRNLQYTSAGS